MVMCDNVKVPWERVFVHDDALLSRDIYIKTPSHCFGNHQSNVRYWSKMRLLLGLCSKIAQATGADQVPAVRETLGKMAAVESTIAGLVHGQINACESWPRGLRVLQPPHHVCRARLVHAELQRVHRRAARALRRRRVPDAGRHLGAWTIASSPQQFTTYWQTPQGDAVSRMKLFKLAWDMVGSEFAGRHQQYEKFYAGASFIVRNHSYRETDWSEFNRLVEDLMATYDYRRVEVPAPASAQQGIRLPVA